MFLFAYGTSESGKYAREAAIKIAEALIADEPYNLQADIDHIKELREDEKLGPTTASIVEETAKRGIAVMRLNNGS